MSPTARTLRRSSSRWWGARPSSLVRLFSPTFLLVTFSTFAYFLAVGAIIPTLPLFVEGPLGGGSVDVGLAMGAFALTAVLLRPYSGRISDRKGRRVLIIGGGVTVGLTMLAYALTNSLGPLLGLRLLTGVGEAAFYVGVATVVNDLAPESRRGEAISYFSVALFSGLALGPIVGETVLQSMGFDPVWAVAGFSSIIAGLVGLGVPETRPARTGPEQTAFINKAALRPGTVLATHIWSLATFSSFVPLYALDLGLSGSRFVFAMQSVIILSIRSLGARLPDVLGPRRSATTALACTMGGLLLMAAWGQTAGLFVGTALFSIGHALAFPALMTLAIRGAPAAERGSVVGTFTAFFDAAFGVGAISAGAIAAALGYRGAFAGAGLIALVGLVLLLGYAREDRRAVAALAREAAASR